MMSVSLSWDLRSVQLPSVLTRELSRCGAQIRLLTLTETRPRILKKFRLELQNTVLLIV